MRAATIVLVLWVSACGGDDDGPSRETGELGGDCYPNGTCNVTLYCSAGLCVTGDGGMGDGGGIGIDAPTNSNCADDSAIEPNDTIGSAFITPVAGTTSSFNLAGLAICPAGDADVYEVNISSTSDVVGTIVRETSTPALTVSVLNSGGTPIALGAATGTALQLRATAANAPAGKYFIQVDGSGMNNYTLQISAN